MRISPLFYVTAEGSSSQQWHPRCLNLEEEAESRGFRCSCFSCQQCCLSCLKNLRRAMTHSSDFPISLQNPGCRNALHSLMKWQRTIPLQLFWERVSLMPFLQRLSLCHGQIKICSRITDRNFVFWCSLPSPAASLFALNFPVLFSWFKRNVLPGENSWSYLGAVLQKPCWVLMYHQIA